MSVIGWIHVRYVVKTLEPRPTAQRQRFDSKEFMLGLGQWVRSAMGYLR